MNYKEYKKSRDLAWEVLIQENVCELPVKVTKICKNRGISIKYWKELPDDIDGLSTIIKGKPYILLNPNRPISRQRFTAAHELGHILLGHIGNNTHINRERYNSKPEEQAANSFAARLLAPACVLWGCNVKTAKEIATLCGISNQAAEIRANRMKELYKRQKFMTSPLEQEVYTLFKDFINLHREDQ